MTCCGRPKRGKNRPQSKSSKKQGPHWSKPAGPIFFQYLGKTGMTVDARASGRRYRFSAPGTTLAIDPRDWDALRFVPMLKEVKQTL